jgi:3-keto-5-aminohexanoate cleavage enzyme
VSAPLVISAAITGGEHGREATPHLPMTPEEIAESVRGAVEAGASIAHIHVWDEHERPTQDLRLYREVYAGLEAAGCDVVLNLTTGPGGEPTEEERMLPLQLRPELASFDAGTMSWGERVMNGSLPFLRNLAARMREANTKPELEVFHDGMIGACLQLAAEGLIAAPLYFQFVLGVPGGAPATAAEILHLRSLIPPDSPWSVAGIGRHSLVTAMAAIPLGGHVRVGLEDQIYYRRGELATSNAQLVARIARLAEEFGRPVATPEDARRILGLKGAERTRFAAAAVAPS